jgi:uncharacterized membrane protein HdeD (DUF308 family)
MDLRTPSGLFFGIIGLILTFMGSAAPDTRAPLTEVNVNLYTGIFMIAFGVFLLVLSWRAARRKA